MQRKDRKGTELSNRTKAKAPTNLRLQEVSSFQKLWLLQLQATTSKLLLRHQDCFVLQNNQGQARKLISSLSSCMSRQTETNQLTNHN